MRQFFAKVASRPPSDDREAEVAEQGDDTHARDDEHAAHRGPGGPRTRAIQRSVAFAVAAVVPVYLALRGGGYDIIARQQSGLVLWWAIALGYAFGLLPRARMPAGSRLAVVALAGLVGWTALSLTWSESDERSFAELARTLNYAGLVVLAWSSLNSNSWRAAAAGLSTGVLAVAAVAVASRLAPGPFPAVALVEGDRLSYPLDYWNAVGAWGAMAVGVGIAWSAHLRRTDLRALCLALVPVAGLATYLSYSRGGAAAAGLAALAVLALSRNRWTVAIHAGVAGAATGIVALVVHGQPAIADGTGGEGGGVVALALALAAAACVACAIVTRRRGLDRFEPGPYTGRRLAVGFAVAALVTTAAVGPSAASRAGEEFASGRYPVAERDPAARLVSLEGSRYEIWSAAMRAFGSEPLTGIGPGAFEFWWGRDATQPETLSDAHSLPLETLAELGLPGLALLLALLGGMLALALEARRPLRRSNDVAAAGAMLAAFLVFCLTASVDWMWELTAVAAVGLGAVAIAGAAASQPRSRSRRLTAQRLAIVALAIGAGAVQVPGIVSTDRLRDSDVALVAGFEDRAVKLADDAIEAEPWSASAYGQRSRSEFADRRFAVAREDAHEAIRRERTNWRHRLLLAKIEAEVGNTDAALAAVADAERLRPGSLRLRGIRRGIAADAEAAAR